MSPLVICYGVIAAAALVGTWYHNIQFLLTGQGESAIDFLVGAFANHAAASISVDIIFFALAACVWMFVEGRRLGIRHIWAYIVFGMCIAISFTFPLFLIARERALQRQAA